MSYGLEIRAVTLDDLTELCALDQDSFPEPWSRSLWKQEISRSNRIYLGAFKGTELIGFIGGLLAHTDFHITTVATKKPHRCSGVGSLLLLRMLKEVDDLCAGIETITLEVRASNKPAQGLYRKFGFAPVGLRRGYYQADNEDAIVMTIEDLQRRFLADRLSEIELKLPIAAFGGAEK
tara:strand:+ start:726 stop:1259 length:534 start_codon:yes stop_codon:yes gene_type:complete